MNTGSKFIRAIDAKLFHKTVTILRTFFSSKGFVEVHVQDRLSILAACEDPHTIATFQYEGQEWPLPQTGQMWLEQEMLRGPTDIPGYFCVTTSYRNEPNPVEGRHQRVFPMFEFELRGGIVELETLLGELVTAIDPNADLLADKYDTFAEYYQTTDLDNSHENLMLKDFSRTCAITNFPLRTSPFWNMSMNSDTHANKIDVIMDGVETVGSAERSCDPDTMRKQFQTISEGGYAQKLYDMFGRERVDKELEEFLSLEFFPRAGGGIGLTRLVDFVSNTVIGDEKV